MVLRVNLPQIPYKADTAVPDYIAALTQGFTQGLKPRSDSEALLSAVLGNKIKATQEKYAEKDILSKLANAAATRAHLGAQTQGLNIENQYLPQKYQLALQNLKRQQEINDLKYKQENDFYNEMNSSYGKNQTQENNPIQVPSKESILNNLSSENEPNVIDQGNPDLYRIDEMYNKSPQYRKKLEAMGYKEQKTIKYDPKSNTTTVITKSPSGKVSVFSNASNVQAQNTGKNLTNELKTRMQKMVAYAPILESGVKELINMPSPVRFGPYRAGAKTLHEAKVKELAEAYAIAHGWPNTNESIHNAEAILERGDNEWDNDYRNRLKKELSKIPSLVSHAEETLGIKSKKQSTKDNDPLGIR